MEIFRLTISNRTVHYKTYQKQKLNRTRSRQSITAIGTLEIQGDVF